MRIKRVNESLNEDYLEECFIEFLQNESNDNDNNYHRKLPDGRWHIQIFLPIPHETTHFYTLDANVFIKHTKELSEVYNRIGNCVDKVKIEYEKAVVHYEFTFDLDNNYKYPISLGCFIKK